MRIRLPWADLPDHHGALLSLRNNKRFFFLSSNDLLIWHVRRRCGWYCYCQVTRCSDLCEPALTFLLKRYQNRKKRGFQKEEQASDDTPGQAQNGRGTQTRGSSSFLCIRRMSSLVFAVTIGLQVSVFFWVFFEIENKLSRLKGHIFKWRFDQRFGFSDWSSGVCRPVYITTTMIIDEIFSAGHKKKIDCERVDDIKRETRPYHHVDLSNVRKSIAAILFFFFSFSSSLFMRLSKSPG